MKIPPPPLIPQFAQYFEVSVGFARSQFPKVAKGFFIAVAIKMRKKKGKKKQFSTDLIAADKSLPFATDLRRNETQVMKTIAFFFFILGIVAFNRL